MEENAQKNDDVYAFIFGVSNVGKSTILYKYLGKEAPTNKTVGVDLQIKELKGNSFFKIRDCSGQERFRDTAKMHCGNSDGAFIVYDITDKNSFEIIGEFANMFRAKTSQTSPIIILGNKTDLKDQRTVSYDEGKNSNL
jgi:Ras-related protein Rab-1A